MDILKLIKQVKREPLPDRWAEDEDINPNYMGGFLTACKYCGDRIAEALHQIHEGKEGNAIQILNHLFDDIT